MDSIPGLGRFPGEGNGNPLQSSCLEDPMDRGAWWATVHRVTKSQKRLSNGARTYLVVFNQDHGGCNQGGRDKGMGITRLSENCFHEVWALTRPVVLKCLCVAELPAGLVKARIPRALSPVFLTLKLMEPVSEFAFLTKGTHFDNQKFGWALWTHLPDSNYYWGQ